MFQTKLLQRCGFKISHTFCNVFHAVSLLVWIIAVFLEIYVLLWCCIVQSMDRFFEFISLLVRIF